MGDLLDASQLQAGTFYLRPGLVDLGPLIQEAVESLQDLAAGQHQRLWVEQTPALPPVRGDARQIFQVLTNLLTNALKFTPAGVTIAVRCWPQGAGVRCEVQDDGPGIPLEQQSRLFQRFGRLAATAEVGGVGLGLFICRALVEAHGGTLELTSGPGLGSTFGC